MREQPSYWDNGCGRSADYPAPRGPYVKYIFWPWVELELRKCLSNKRKAGDSLKMCIFCKQLQTILKCSGSNPDVICGYRFSDLP